MIYTHCRGCGRTFDATYDNPETADGVCLQRLGGPESCTARLVRFEKTLPPENQVPDEGVFWKTPAWSVLVDQWLEAGAP